MYIRCVRYYNFSKTRYCERNKINSPYILYYEELEGKEAYISAQEARAKLPRIVRRS